MRRFVIFPMFILACLLIAGLQTAQAESITLKDGHMLVGDVVETTDDSVTFRYDGGEGEMKTATFKADDLDPHSFYDVRSRTLPDDPKAHINLAKFCAENRMFARCMSVYQKAKSLYPDYVGKFDEEEKPRLREQYAAELLENALEARERGKLKLAEEEIQILMTYLHDTKAGEEAKALIREIALERLEAERAASEELGDDPSLLRILLKDGSTLRATVVSTDDDSVRVQIPRSGGLKVTRNYHVSDLDPYSYFEIRSMDIGEDPAAHLRLIRFCIDHQMYTRGYYTYERLKAIDPVYVEHFEREELPALREKIGEELIESGKEALDEGRLDDARSDLAFVITRLEGTEVAQKARLLVDILAQKRTESEKAARDGMIAKLKTERKEAELKAYQETLKILEPAQKLIDRGRKKNQEALKNDRGRAAVKKYEGAANDFKQAVRQLDSLMKRHEGDANIRSMISDLRGTAVNEAVGAYINAGRVYMNRTSFRNAENCANKALDVDPDNAAAAAFRAEVQAAELAHSGDWDRRRPRRRGR